MEGTFLYMPPEVQEGGDWTKAGDVYSLGSVVYRLLTGKRPVGRWKSPNEMVSGLPSWWDDLLGNCLSDQGERYANGEALLSAYERAVSSPQSDASADGSEDSVVPASISEETLSIEPLLKRAFIFLRDGAFAKADEYFEKILDTDPENARAYVGKLMAQLRVKEEKNLADSDKPLTEYDNYRHAIEFADVNYRGILGGYDKAVQEKLESERKEKVYQEALSKMKSGNSERDFENASQQFSSVSGYRNADDLSVKCWNVAKEMARTKTKKAKAEKRREFWTKWRTPIAIAFVVACLAGFIFWKQYFSNITKTRNAANQGIAEAQYALAQMYEKGQRDLWLSVPQDSRQAVEWYRKAAEQGHSGAQNNLREKERLEKERAAAERERLEKERVARAERERLEKERAARAERERLEKERAAQAERERLEKERVASRIRWTLIIVFAFVGGVSVGLSEGPLGIPGGAIAGAICGALLAWFIA
jgi:TPR repeat protein